MAGKGIFCSHISFQTFVCCIQNQMLHICLPTPVAVTPNNPSTTSNRSLLSPPVGEDVSCCNCAFALLMPSFTPTSPTSTASVSSTPPTVVATAKRPAKAKMLKLPDPEDNQPGDEQCRKEKICKIPFQHGKQQGIALCLGADTPTFIVVPCFVRT